MTGLATLLVLAIVLAVLAVAAYWIRFQLRLRSHKGMDKTSFVDHFARGGVTPDIAAAVYDHYRGVAVWQDFRLSPEDDLEQVFGHAPEEMDASLDAILRKLHLSLPPPAVVQSQDRKLTTVADVVSLVAWIGSHQDVRP